MIVHSQRNYLMGKWAIYKRVICIWFEAMNFNHFNEFISFPATQLLRRFHEISSGKIERIWRGIIMGGTNRVHERWMPVIA